MINQSEDQDYLILADRRIGELERKMRDLLYVIQEKKVKGEDTALETEVLADSHQVLQTLREFRLQAISRLRASSTPR